ALAKSEKYGVLVLLFSWLPIVGDIFCGIAGWLRFSLWQSILFIVIGKLLRYLFLLATLYSVLPHIL
ncbi:TPA: DedA family protein, partial [Mannheimia haemolytica]|nr:DedA family protein [Mannheimia haemolytica]